LSRQALNISREGEISLEKEKRSPDKEKILKDRVFCGTTGINPFLVRSGGKPNSEEGLVCSFCAMGDKIAFCKLFFCMPGKSGWDVEGKVVQGCPGKEGKWRSGAT